MATVVLTCYLIDAALLAGYAWQGRVPVPLPVCYAATGLGQACALLWLSRRHGPDIIISSRSVFVQATIALVLILGSAWLYPVVGLPLLLTAISVIATCALRLRPASSVALIAGTSAAMVLLLLRHSVELAMPVHTQGELLVSGLFVCWTLIKVASTNAIGAQLRAELSTSYARLTEALSEVERLASVDELTGLPNRRAILRHLEAVHEQAQTTGGGVGVSMLDIDHFKQINDRYGHPVGDAVLGATGALLKRSLRSSDLVGRVGGEEFLLLVDSADVKAMRGLGERIRLCIESHDWSAIQPDLRVTVSVGMTLGRSDEHLEEWLARADQMLYLAKTGGRNRVVVEPKTVGTEVAVD